MRCSTFLAASILVALSATANATTFSFESDPFAGSTALTTPGRQIVGGESFINFDIGSDIFAFAPAVFGVADQVLFANDVVANLPATGVNVVVLQSFDNDSNPVTPFNAGTAANLIADQFTSSGAGFFIYFNQGLDLPRLVYSTDLSDNTADLKVLARMVNLSGQPGRDAFPTFAASNFAMISAVPEPSSLLMITVGALMVFGFGRRRLHSGCQDTRQMGDTPLAVQEWRA